MVVCLKGTGVKGETGADLTKEHDRVFVLWGVNQAGDLNTWDRIDGLIWISDYGESYFDLDSYPTSDIYTSPLRDPMSHPLLLSPSGFHTNMLLFPHSS